MTAKDITKLQQDLREAQAMGNTAKSTEISNQILRAVDVIKALKGGYTQQEAEQFANREATIRDTDQKRRVSEAEAAFESQSKARVSQNIGYLEKQLKSQPWDDFTAASIQRQILDNQKILSGINSGQKFKEAAEAAASERGKLEDFRNSTDGKTFVTAMPHLLKGKSIEEAKTLAEKEIQTEQQKRWDAHAAGETLKREREILENQERNKLQQRRPALMDAVRSTYRDAGPVQGRDPDPIGTAIKNDPLNKQGFIFGNQDERRAYMGSPDKEPGSGKSIYQRLTPQEYGALNLAAQSGDATAKNELDKRFQQGQRYLMDSVSAQALKNNSQNFSDPRSNTGRLLTAAEEAKRDAGAKQQEDMKTRDLQFRLQQEARARDGQQPPRTNQYTPAGKSIPGKPGSVSDGQGGWSYSNPLNNDPDQARRLRDQGLTPEQNQAAIKARQRAANPGRKGTYSKPDNKPAPFKLTTFQTGAGGTLQKYVKINPDGTKRDVTQDDWNTHQGKDLLKKLKINSDDSGLGRIVTTGSGRSKKTTATPSSPGLVFRKIDGQVRAFSPTSSASSNSPAKTGMR